MTPLSGMSDCMFMLSRSLWANENARKWPSRLLGVVLLREAGVRDL